MAHRFKEGSYEGQLAEARERMRAWVRYAIKSSNERLAWYDRIADKYGLDDRERALCALVREGAVKAEKIGAKIDSMSLADIEDFLSRNRIPQ